MNRVSFVIPTKNEEKTLPGVLKSIREESSKLGIVIDKIVIVDDSSDQTRAVATREKTEILSGGGRGLGEAMFRGLKYASNSDVDYIVSVDGDGQANLDELKKLLQPLQKGNADLVLSSRRLEKNCIKYKYPLINAVGIRLLVWFLRRGTGLNLTDSHGGLRAMRRQVAEELDMIGIHTYVQETIFDAFQKGFRIVEIPGEWSPRQGKSRVLDSIPKYIFHTFPVIILRCGYHMNYFFPFFLILFVLGNLSCMFSWIHSLENRFLITGGILIITGFMGIGFTIILEFLLSNRLRHHEIY